jgi:hypothetical protein
MRCDATCHVKPKRELATKLMKRSCIAKKKAEIYAEKKRTTFLVEEPPPVALQSKKGVLLYEIEDVLGKLQCECGTVKYLVKWKGYPSSMNSCIARLPKVFRTAWA